MTKSYEFMGFGPFYVHMVEIPKLTPASPFFFFNFGVPCPSITKQQKKSRGHRIKFSCFGAILMGLGPFYVPRACNNDGDLHKISCSSEDKNIPGLQSIFQSLGVEGPNLHVESAKAKMILKILCMHWHPLYTLHFGR